MEPNRTRPKAARGSDWTADVPALFRATDVSSFVRAAHDALRSVVACDFVSLIYRSTGRALLKERDSRGRTYSAAFMRRYAELTPAVRLALEAPGVRLLATRHGLPSRELKRTAFYQEVMRPQGWRHAVALCFWTEPDGGFPAVVLSVNRREGREDFSDADLARLEAAYPILDAAVGRLLERSASRGIAGGMSLALRHVSRGVIVLDAQGRTILANPAARRLSAAWRRHEPGRTPDGDVLPAAIQDACDTLVEKWRSEMRGLANPRSRRSCELMQPDGDGTFAAHVTLDCRAWIGKVEPTFLVELRHDPNPAAPLPPIRQGSNGSLLDGLTSAEERVARALADGLSNKEIAARLGKTVDAVKFLLHRIYRKVGVSNRTRLVAVLRHHG